MAQSQEIEDFEEVIERIVFKEEELEELKIAIRNFSKGTITTKQLKQNLLRCRGRIVKDISNFLIFNIDRARNTGQAQDGTNSTNSNQSDLTNDQIRQEIAERNELLEIVTKRISALSSKAKKEPPSETESFS